MRNSRRSRSLLTAAATGALVLGVLAAAGPASAAGTAAGPGARAHGPADVLYQKQPLRVATYNLSSNRNAAGQLVSDLSTPDNAQAKTVAEVIQRADPDVILLNEFDYVEGGAAVDLFRANYSRSSRTGRRRSTYPYAFVAPSNTGIPSGFDLNNDGVVGGGDDAFGFGLFPGQYGMVVLSKHPIQAENVRTFQNFLWKDMPGALLPDDPATAAPNDWFTPAELDVVRLSSKSHWDVPVTVGGHTVHVLASHPTPPTFDGPEDRNGRRNHDEIRFWADYITPGAARYIVDDAGRKGGLKPRRLVRHPRRPERGSASTATRWMPRSTSCSGAGGSRTRCPRRPGRVEAAALQGGANAAHEGDPAYDTADFADTAPGNLRADYVLPSLALRITDAGVFWPTKADPLFRLTGVFPFPSSDHRLVWVDVRVPRIGR